MTPAAAIASLDRALARSGSVVTLRRTVGTDNQAVWDAEDVPAKVRDYRPDELVPGGNPQQGGRHVVVSPSALTARGWPVGGGDPQRHDHCFIAGVECHIEDVRVTRIGETAVRYDLRVMG